MRQEIEAVLVRLHGVVAARVIENERGEIERIRILVRQGQLPRPVVRSALTTIQAKLGLHIEPSLIQVVVVRGSLERELWPIRLRLAEIEEEHQGLQLVVRVNLWLGSERITGEARGVERPYQNGILAAEAAVQAITRAFGAEGRFWVVDSRLVSSPECPVVVVVIRLQSAEEPEYLTGCAPAVGSETEPWVRATLSALNRQLALATPAERP